MKNNKGFSLVELIVVIAIMAILAAVAVVGFSVYIPKAQQANDEQLISDIEYAITLMSSTKDMPNEYGTGSLGFVVITKDGTIVGGEQSAFLDEALKATFGETYGSELKLAYDKWEAPLVAEDYESIVGSNFYGDENVEDLFNKVQTLTGALSDYYGGNEMGANQTVLDLAQAAVENSDKVAFVDWWTTPGFTSIVSLKGTNAEGAEVALFTAPEGCADDEYVLKCELAAAYARAEAFVLYSGCTTCYETFTNGSAGFNGISNPTGAITAIGQIMTDVQTHIEGGEGCSQCQAKMQTYFSDSAENDANAYIALMGQVNNMSDKIASNENFSSGDLFTSDFVMNAVSGFMSAAQAFTQSGAQPGDVVIAAIVEKDGSVSYQVYPIDY